MNPPSKKSKWSSRYGDRHRYVPILDDPLLPNSRRGRVRIYHRGPNNSTGNQHFILNWFENGRNCKHTVQGDKFTAVSEADRINQRFSLLGRTGLAAPNLTIMALVDRFCEHLDRRADAGEISPRTAARYRNALQYLHRFTKQSVYQNKPSGTIDDRFVLEFKAWLRTIKIHPNGHPNTTVKPLSQTGLRYILAAARMAWNWAQRHNPPLLPDDVRNPFCGHGREPLRELLASSGMESSDGVKLIESADLYQLTLLLPLMLYGLRAAEPCGLMIEAWDRRENLLRIGGIPELDYQTKGRIDKVLPVPPVLEQLLALAAGGRAGGPLLLSRRHFERHKAVSPTLTTKQQIVLEYRRRLGGDRSARRRVEILNSLLFEAGAVSYDQISREFHHVAHRAQLPENVTLKSLRHHFAGALEKANISYFTRKYFMGHRVRRDPLAVYTSTDIMGLRQEFNRLLDGPLVSIVEATIQRINQLNLSDR